MLAHIDIEKVLFLDIETVPEYPNYTDVPERFQKLWDKKSKSFVGEEETSADVYNRAGIYAEFGKIVCISVGFVARTSEGLTLRITSFANDDESILLNEFATLLNKHYYNIQMHRLCGHNGKEFDFPFIARRMLIHGMALPALLNIGGLKPWENPHLDTMTYWKFGEFKNFTSLDLLAAIFEIPTPKDDIDGSQVYGVYYEENDLDRIVEYCQKDVVTLVQVYRRLAGQSLIEESNIKMV
ncbi:3'-5' exonuclease [bacterium SCSIO 12643]|nr:3'-5' exonuclease [bacterium SCSIO 12643]